MQTVNVAPEVLKSRLGSKNNLYMHCRITRKFFMIENINSWTLLTTLFQNIDVVYLPNSE